MMTSNCAYALHREDEIGSLEPGKLADFVVLDGDPTTCPEEEIKSIPVRATAIGGSVGFGAL